MPSVTELMQNRTTDIIAGLAAAKGVCQRIRERGAVVTSVTIEGQRAVILIERPPRDLKAGGELIRILNDNHGRRIVREYDMVGCAVRWEESK